MSTQGGASGEPRANGEPVRRPRPARLTVRPAGTCDEVPLGFFFDTVLRKDYFLRRGQLAEILCGSHHRVYIAEIDSVLVGVAILTANTRLVNALVHPAYRGLGIGKALVEESGAREVRAKIDMSTGDPRGFYRSLGFRSTGVRNAKGNIELMRRGAGGKVGTWKGGKEARQQSAADDTQQKRRCERERQKQNRPSAA